MQRRVAQLDNGLGDPRAELVHFTSVLAEVTDTGAVAGIVSAADADAVLADCHLLRRLGDVVPEVVTGPLAARRQYWISTGKPSHLQPGHPAPEESRFIAATHAAVSTKPFGVGLFTATGVLGGHGMWRGYLDLHRESTLHPMPWHTWTVTPAETAIVREITSAVQWTDFVRSYPRRNGDLTYPDWARVAADYDAVHLTLRAIAAIQGICFPIADGLTAATYWDIESTLWLRWCFRAIESVDDET